MEDDVLARDATLAVLKEIFRPASPTINRKLFKGRDRELSLVLGAISDIGMHAVIYGERGVGKTSLGLMAREAFVATRPTSLTVRLACTADDTFGSLWGRLCSRLISETDLLDQFDAARFMPTIDRIESLFENDGISPATVTRAIHLLGSKTPAFIIIDEFDRLGHNAQSTELFADLIKSLSDDPIPVTLLLIGVADDVTELVQGHASIDRSLRQVHMPRMKRRELMEVVEEGVSEFQSRSGQVLRLDQDVTTSIVSLSQGFPYYTHLLASSIIERAILEGAPEVGPMKVIDALFDALDSAAQSIRSSYADAVHSNQNAQFADTLLACALSPVDVLGYFVAPDVVSPLESITGVKRTTANFHAHLKRFVSPKIAILEKKPGSASRYRFSDPLMKPFVLMTGVQEGRWSIEKVQSRVAK